MVTCLLRIQCTHIYSLNIIALLHLAAAIVRLKESLNYVVFGKRSLLSILMEYFVKIYYTVKEKCM